MFRGTFCVCQWVSWVAITNRKRQCDNLLRVYDGSGRQHGERDHVRGNQGSVIGIRVERLTRSSGTARSAQCSWRTGTDTKPQSRVHPAKPDGQGSSQPHRASPSRRVAT